MTERDPIDDLRGASRLAVDATRGVTSIVEEMHRTIAVPAVLGRSLDDAHRAMVAPVYGAVRGVTSLVGFSLDAALRPLSGTLPPGDRRDLVAAVNGVVGDHLASTGNPLALEMTLRAASPGEGAGKRLLLLVPGLCMSDRGWTRHGHDHGAALGRDLGVAPLYLSYNSGLHISTNGQRLALLLEEAQAVADAEELLILGHSMGGLVARSACDFAERAGHAWRSKLGKLVCLGSPHHGTALERGGNLLQVAVGVSRYSAPLARLGMLRSAGVTDLRYGNVLDADWQGRDRFAHSGDERTPLPLPEGVTTYALAASTARTPGDRAPGDGLVSIDSALGRHPDPDRALAFSHETIAHGTHHLDLLSSREVYATLREWLE